MDNLSLRVALLIVVHYIIFFYLLEKNEELAAIFWTLGVALGLLLVGSGGVL